jgi:signal transduction histidine kinase/integral membrane sensor domain MASE1
MSVSRGAALLRSGHPALLAAVAAFAYYGAAWAGLHFRVPGTTPSVMWPPNAVLTALLLFVPPRRWLPVLLGAAVAHFATELPVWPTTLVGLLFLTNCGEAIFAAGTLRFVSDEPSRFDSLRRVSLFIVTCGLAAPFVSSFFDAGVVSAIIGEDFWTVWRIRFLSNVLAQVVIVPTIAELLNSLETIRAWNRRRWLDATTIAAGLLLVTIAVSADIGRIGLLRAPLAAFLPLMLWAAVRFGAGAVGLTVLATLALAIESDVLGYGIFLQGAPAEYRVGALQMFFISATMPMLCVGALVEERQRAVAALHASDVLKSSILDSMSSTVAVVGRDGRTIAVNEKWRRTAREYEMTHATAAPGAPYRDVWTEWVSRTRAHAGSAYQSIEDCVAGTSQGATVEYVCETADGGRWWMMSVVPLQGSEGGAVVKQTDITSQKRAELEAQRRREELAHVSRVWVMGELAAALSHQLKQPLTGIMGNAQAGLRFLTAAPPRVNELREILEDIASDAERAAAVTQAVREMIRRETSGRELLDLSEVVHETASLVATQCSTHRVALNLLLNAPMPPVAGDRTQLRQVVLNLLMNAIEAVSGNQSDDRTVTVTTEPTAQGVRVSVHDSGQGLPAGAEEQVFEPLFTTKQDGMGMGLSIARAIVEAHGGVIQARQAAGALFQFSLPTQTVSSPAESAAVPLEPPVRAMTG